MANGSLKAEGDLQLSNPRGETCPIILSTEAKDVQVTNTERACRVTIHICDAKNLKKKENGSDVRDPVFKVKVENVKQRSHEIKSVTDQYGNLIVNQSFTFEVKDVKNAVLSVRVSGRGKLGLEESIGCMEDIKIANILEQMASQKIVSANWCNLYSKRTRRLMPGKVKVRVKAGIAKPKQKISLFIGTWNVGNSRPPKDLSHWIPLKYADYEIVAIGSQECDYPPRQPFTDCGKDWVHTLSSHLGSRYKVVENKNRGQMRLTIFVRDDAEKAITELDHGSEATGVGHVIANKGGVCVAFKFWDTGLCFVNSHLAAHPGQAEARNSNYREIAGQLRVGLSTMDILNQYHHVFWFGDLNYRLDLSQAPDNPMTTKKPSWDEVVEKINDGKYLEYLQFDELRREMSAHRVLDGFEEGEIQFAPTFKMRRDKGNKYDPKRLPAWCDRILWRNLPGCSIKLERYFSAPQLFTSDHKPVAALIKLTAHALPTPLAAPKPTEDDGNRWHVEFTSLRAKHLRASDINGSSDPYLSFVGPNLIHEFHSKVKYQTLDPIWDPTHELPRLVLNAFPMARLEKEYLLVRIFDRDFTSADDTLGYTVIPLAQAVTAFRIEPEESALRGSNQFVPSKARIAHFKVTVTHHGLPAGTLEGDMKLTWEKNVARRGQSKHKWIGRTLTFTHTIKRRVLNVIP